MTETSQLAMKLRLSMLPTLDKDDVLAVHVPMGLRLQGIWLENPLAIETAWLGWVPPYFQFVWQCSD